MKYILVFSLYVVYNFELELSFYHAIITHAICNYKQIWTKLTCILLEIYISFWNNYYYPLEYVLNVFIKLGLAL